MGRFFKSCFHSGSDRNVRRCALNSAADGLVAEDKKSIELWGRDLTCVKGQAEFRTPKENENKSEILMWVIASSKRCNEYWETERMELNFTKYYDQSSFGCWWSYDRYWSISNSPKKGAEKWLRLVTFRQVTSKIYMGVWNLSFIGSEYLKRSSTSDRQMGGRGWW